MTSFLEVEGLTKRFGGLVAVDHVNLQIGREEIVGLIGPNGSGKTTLVRLIIGLLKPDAGKVRFKGEDITHHRSWEIVGRGIAMTHQVVKPFRHLPIISNVMVGCLAKGASKRGEWVKRIEARARDALEFCGIADLAKEPASILPHGDLKRLELARALATEPELLLLDEPFGGLNPAETELVAKSLRRLHKGGRFGRLHSEGPAMLIIEHKLADLMKIVDRVIVLNFGKILTEGTPQEIANNKQVMEAYAGRRGG
jgi:branched-chain amino acid transport system ATP-binding protein